MISELRRDDPASVGSYRLLGRLGTGGMGQVFLGQSPGGRLVAVKVIRPELADEPGFRARFAREVTAARNVSGMFTALVVDADPEAPVPWLATAYVSGPSLAPWAVTPGARPATWRAPPGHRPQRARQTRRPPTPAASAGARWPGWAVPWRWPPRRRSSRPLP